MNVIQWTGVGILVVVGLVFFAEFLTRVLPSRNGSDGKNQTGND